MSNIDQTVLESNIGHASAPKKRVSPLAWLLSIACSVRFGVLLLVLLGAACFTGMVIMQQNVDGFARYFAQLTPAQRLVYSSLGLFDIYHSWYFNLLLALLSINIILASIDRFPRTWAAVSKPNSTVPLRWLREQQNAKVIERDAEPDTLVDSVRDSMIAAGWRKTLTGERNGVKYVFGERGRWNRFGAYPVHVALLTIFVGGFMTAQLSRSGQMPLGPGAATDVIFDTVVALDKTNEVTLRVPFTVECTDIQQKLIRKEGSLSAMNTIDWITRFRIRDETGVHDAMVQMNHPFDYRGYRFFQSSFTPTGRARSVVVEAKNMNGQTESITIPRSGTTALADGTTVKLTEFKGNFTIGESDPNEDTSDYPNPGAVLSVTPPNGQSQTAYAFGPDMAEMPVAKKPIAGYTFRLTDFEKVADQHVLSVQHDPGTNVVYVGFILLVLTLAAVFFFSHQRIWAAIEPRTGGGSILTIAGTANRDLSGFAERTKALTNKLETSE